MFRCDYQLAYHLKFIHDEIMLLDCPKCEREHEYYQIHDNGRVYSYHWKHRKPGGRPKIKKAKTEPSQTSPHFTDEEKLKIAQLRLDHKDISRESFMNQVNQDLGISLSTSQMHRFYNEAERIANCAIKKIDEENRRRELVNQLKEEFPNGANYRSGFELSSLWLKSSYFIRILKK